MVFSLPAWLTTCEKSPARSAAVGTLNRLNAPALFTLRSNNPKKNVRFLMIGPPSEPPYWCICSGAIFAPDRLEKKLLAFSALLRRNSKALPCKLFVPDLVTIVVMPPPLLPYTAE